MSDRAQLDEVFKSLEAAANSQDFDRVAPHIAQDAVYWFTDGRSEGLEAIREAFERTWQTIRDETYVLSNVKWIAVSESVAVCIYDFRSRGVVSGRPFAASGRGTNVFVRSDGVWRVVHEHLSGDPSEPGTS